MWRWQSHYFKGLVFVFSPLSGKEPFHFLCVVFSDYMYGNWIQHCAQYKSKTWVIFENHPFLNMIFPTPHTPLSFPSLLLIHLLSSSHASCGPAAAVCVATNTDKAGETHHDRQITMLQHHTNWPGAYRESLVFSSLVFWDVRAEGG